MKQQARLDVEAGVQRAEGGDRGRRQLRGGLGGQSRHDGRPHLARRPPDAVCSQQLRCQQAQVLARHLRQRRPGRVPDTGLIMRNMELLFPA